MAEPALGPVGALAARRRVTPRVLTAAELSRFEAERPTTSTQKRVAAGMSAEFRWMCEAVMDGFARGPWAWAVSARARNAGMRRDGCMGFWDASVSGLNGE